MKETVAPAARLEPGQEGVRALAGGPGAPLLVPVMRGATWASYLTLAAVWLAVLGTFWWWWLSPGHGLDPLRFGINCAILFWTTVVPGYFVAVVARARMPNPAIPVPSGLRVAMVVTKAPSEPFEVVEKTLRAMLAQTYPHDTWLADEDPSPQTRDWCARHGIRISTRKGVSDYHRSSWPRRTKCKEGNLAYFYDHYGYDAYEYVAQLDADHVPSPSYLEEMLRPFADKRVGYVSAPSICDSNAGESWSARGRLHIEGPFHGSLQAGYNGGLAPTCIGSHYAVRTAALQQIGGLGPELAEDHSTTLIMNAHGWRGVHALNAIAHGEGPRAFADLATQEFQWSKSLVIILLRYTRHYFGKLPLRLKGQFLFCQLWYPLTSLSMLGALLLPVLALLTGRVWAAVNYVAYLGMGLTLMASMFAVMYCVKGTGTFRPASTKLMSWEGVVFLFARWPWVLMGTLSAVVDWIRGREFGFRVTAKGSITDDQAPLHVVAPYLAISLGTGVPLLTVSDPGNAKGFYLICIMISIAYWLVAAVIAVSHVRERGRFTPVAAILFADHSRVRNALFALGLAVVVCGTYLRLMPGLEAVSWHQSPRPVMASSSAPHLALGVYDPDQGFARSDRLAIDHIFVSWTNPGSNEHIRQSFANAQARNRWLMVTVEPWPAQDAGPAGLLADIVGRRYDAAIRSICKTMAEPGVPVFVRWGHEMEVRSGRYPWAGGDPSSYVRAYRHFVDHCREVSDKFLYVWSPAGDASLNSYFPGEQYADFVGLSVYDCPRCGVVSSGGKASAAHILHTKYGRVDQYRLPVIVAELGVDGEPAYREAELRELLASLGQYPRLHAVLYFNARDTAGAWPVLYVPDWRIDAAFFPATNPTPQPARSAAAHDPPTTNQTRQ